MIPYYGIKRQNIVSLKNILQVSGGRKTHKPEIIIKCAILITNCCTMHHENIE